MGSKKKSATVVEVDRAKAKREAGPAAPSLRTPKAKAPKPPKFVPPLPAQEQPTLTEKLDHRPVTMFEIAVRELGLPPDTGSLNDVDFVRAGVAMLGGCCGCGEMLGAYNAYPGRNGYWHCRACLPPDDAFYDLNEAHAFCFEDV